jgi:hypothetical protein
MDTRTKGTTTISKATTTTGALIVFLETGPNCDAATLFGITKELKNLRREYRKMKMVWKAVMEAKPPGPMR